MYCTVCGKKSGDVVCDECKKKGIPAFLHAVEDAVNQFGKSLMVTPKSGEELSEIDVPEAIARMTDQIMTEGGGRNPTSCGVFMVFSSPDGRMDIIHRQADSVNLGKIGQKAISLSLAKHFRVQAAVDEQE